MAIIRKERAAGNDSGMEFILSDATVDRYGDIIEASGWDLTEFNKNPIALFNHDHNFPVGRWENLRIEKGALRGHLRLAPKGTSPRIDEIRGLIEAGVLRAVSVGFRPLESMPLNHNNGRMGERYTKSELMETSVVSIPANPNALAVAKSLNVSPETLEIVFAKNGKGDDGTVRRDFPASTPKSKTPPHHSGNPTMSGLAGRIQTLQEKVVAARDDLETHVASYGDEATDEQITATAEKSAHIEKLEASLTALKAAEVQLSRAAGSGSRLPAVSSSAQPPKEPEGEQPLSRTSFPKLFAQVETKKTTPFDFLVKALAVDLVHFGEQRKRNINDVIKQHYGDQPDMGEMVRRTMSLMVNKAAAIPADTTTSGWADKLVQTVQGDFIEALMPYSVYPAIAARGKSFTFGRNGVITLPSRTQATAIGGAFVAQGAAIPVKQGAFGSISLTPKKMGVITTMTREITEHSIPAIENILRQAILEDTAIAIDTVLLDATAADTTRPAGLKNGISKVSATAGGAVPAAILGDLKGLMAALITATNGNLRAPAWIMNPGDVLAASVITTTSGETPFREELARGTLLGVPVIQSTTGLSDMMALIDCADFISATGDTPNFTVSDQAVLHMEDTSPAALSAVATPNTVAAPIRSLFQTDTIAIRMIMQINWAKRRAGIFQWTDTMTWN